MMDRVAPFLLEPGRDFDGAVAGFAAPEGEMAEFKGLGFIIHKHLRAIALVFGLAVLGTAIMLFAVITPLYTSECTLVIEPHAPRVLNVQDDLSAPDMIDFAHDYYKSQYQILSSRVLAARVIRQQGLEHDPQFLRLEELRHPLGWVKRVLIGLRLLSSHTRPQPGLLGVDWRLIDAYEGALKISPVEETRLVKVAFSTQNPQLSARIANAHAAAYIAMETDLRAEAGEAVQQFLENKLKELRDRTTKSEEALNAYSRTVGTVDNLNQLGATTEQGSESGQRLAQLSRLYTEAEAARIGLEAQMQLVDRGDYEALPAVMNSESARALRTQLDTLKEQYASLSAQFTDDYSEVQQLKAQITETATRLHETINRIVKEIKLNYAAAQANEKSLADQVQQQKDNLLSLRDASVQYAILARDVDTNRQLYESVVSKMKEMGVASQLRVSNISVVEPAAASARPASPQKLLVLLLSSVAGLLAGVCLAFVLEVLDDSFENPVELERCLSLPNLAVVPHFASLGHSVPSSASGPELLPEANSSLLSLPIYTNGHLLAPANGAIAAEAYQTLRMDLKMWHSAVPARILLFTSSNSGEGKTVTALNTAIIHAQAGAKVLLLDAELRRSTCHKLLQVDNRAGLSDVLANRITVKEAVRAIAPGLYLMSAGSPTANPGAMLGSLRMRDLLAELGKTFDYVIIDCCPVMPVSDALALCAIVDGVIFVVGAHTTPKWVARQALLRLIRAKARLLGTVLNGVDMRRSEYAYHYYRAYQPFADRQIESDYLASSHTVDPE